MKIQTTLITHGGQENQGGVSKFIVNETRIEKLFAQKDIIQSNSMVEATDKRTKYYYLFKKNVRDRADTVYCLAEAVLITMINLHGRRYGYKTLEQYENINYLKCT